jgi:hypothetical protein
MEKQVVGPVYAFSASLTCCPPPTVLSSDENCLGSSDGFITVTGQGVAPFDYQWIDPLGNTFSNNNINGPNTENNLSPGNYNITVIDDNGCITSTSVTILAGGQANTQGIWHN